MSDVIRMKLREADHPVGVKKKSRYVLPPEDHVYGLPNKRDPEGASIVTRSWKEHEPSPNAKPPKDFIKMNQLNTEESKVPHYRKPVCGKKDRSIDLPPESFVYGMKSKPHESIKDVINNVFGNKAEEDIRKSYENFLEEKNIVKRLITRTTPHYLKMKERRKDKGHEETKPLYKLKMFQDVGSKVAEGIKAFKTYKPAKTEGGLNNIIEKVQEEIKVKEDLEKPKQ